MKNKNTNRRKSEFQKKSNRVQKSETITKTEFTKPLSSESNTLLNEFDQIIKTAMPLSAKQEKELPHVLKRLFEDLTTERSARRLNYLNEASNISAYVYHYMQWNIFKLVKVFSTLDFSYLKDEDYIADFGAGPLTVACAMWIAKPELRKKKLNWYCIDNAGKALSTGEEIFLTLCTHTQLLTGEETTPWNIIKITDKFGTRLKNKINLYTSANMFNEFFSNSNKKLFDESLKIANTIDRYLKPNGNALIIEPGIPIGGELITALRTMFLAKGFNIISPCTHNDVCPLPATKSNHIKCSNYLLEPNRTQHSKTTIAFHKWCHFSFPVDDAPLHLKNFSASSNLPKENTSLSFLYCSNSKAKRHSLQNMPVRITSDLIQLPDYKIGRYCCSSHGFLLLTTNKSNSFLMHISFGDIINLPLQLLNSHHFDKKSGAKIIELIG